MATPHARGSKLAARGARVAVQEGVEGPIVFRARLRGTQRVVRLESATYEIIEAEHTVDSLVKAFSPSPR